MNDLIRKSDVLDLLYVIFNKYRMSTDKTHSICNSFGNEVFEEIRNMPTAYDIDKIVEELEDWSFETKILVPNNNELGEYEEEIERKIICTQNAIEIVKQSGVGKET